MKLLPQYAESVSAVHLYNVFHAEMHKRELAKDHVFLQFDIQNALIQRIGRVEILINKTVEFDKWRDPTLAEHEAIDIFKLKYPEVKHVKLTAFYRGDLIPTLNP